MTAISFGAVDWSSIMPTRHAGNVGAALWRMQVFGLPEYPIQVRMVVYTPGYVPDHWCSKGHILLCLSGELETMLAEGAEAHHSTTKV